MDSHSKTWGVKLCNQSDLIWLGVSFVWQPGKTGLSPLSNTPCLTYPSYMEFPLKPLKIPFAEQRQEQSVFVQTYHISLPPTILASSLSHLRTLLKTPTFHIPRKAFPTKDLLWIKMAAVQRLLQRTIHIAAREASAVRLTFPSSVFFLSELSCLSQLSDKHDVEIAFSLVFSVFQMTPLDKLEIIIIHKCIC